MSFSRKRFPVIIACFLITLCFVPLLSQQTDELEHHILSEIDRHVQWHNIKKGPRWLDGPDPVYLRSHLLHTIPLEPGHTITLRLERDEILRGLAINKPFKREDVAISRSNGTGLHMKVIPSFSSEFRSFLVFPVWRTGSIVKITRPRSFTTPVSIALFYSRDGTPKPLLDYFHPIKCPGKTVSIRRIDEASPSLFTFLEANRKVKLELRGPMRLRFETRLKYPRETWEARQSFHIHTILDGQKPESLSFKTTLERQFPVKVNGTSQVLSRLRYSYLDIPKGNHTLNLKSTAPIYLALSAIKHPNKKFLRGQGAVFSKKAPCKILELLKDIKHRETGLAAAAAMAEYDNGIAASDIWNHHTFYRSLQPWQKHEREFPRIRTVFPRKSLNPLAKHQRSRGTVIDKQFREDDLESLPRGDFFPLKGEMIYYVPALNAPSSLRVAVLKKDIKKPASFDVRMGDNISLSLTLPLTFYPRPEVPNEELDISPAKWASQVEHKETAYVEIPMPPGISYIRLKRHENNETELPLYVALAYRASRPFSLSEFDYKERIGKYEGINWFKTLCSDETSFPDKGFAAHHMPLLRFLRARLRSFEKGITEAGHIARSGITSTAPIPAAQRQKIREEAFAWEEKKQWLNALEAWNRIGGKQGRVRALIGLNEFFLAELQLKGLVLYERQPLLRQWAVNRLDQFYRSQGQDDKLLVLRAAEAYLHPSVESLKKLARALNDEGQIEFAYQLSMLAGDNSKGKPPKPLYEKDIWNRSQDYRILDCAGFAALYNPERDLYGDYARVTPQRPLSLEFKGPAKVNMLIRPLHRLNDEKETMPINTWLRLSLDGSERPLAVSNNKPADGLQLTGPQQKVLLPGTKVETHLDLGPGNHLIYLASDEVPLLVRLEERKNLQSEHVRNQVSRLLRQAEQLFEMDPYRADFLAAQAAYLYHRAIPKDDTLYSLYSRLRTQRRWEPVTPVIHSAGLLPVTIQGWQPESPYIRTRRSLLPPLAKGEMLLDNGKQLDVILNIQKDRHITVLFGIDTPEYLEQRPATLQITLDGKLYRMITLEPVKHSYPGKVKVPMDLKAGGHVLSFVSATAANHFVRMTFQPDIERELTRFYHTATPTEPMHIRVPGGSWLRVEQLKKKRGKNQTLTRYLFVPRGKGDKLDRDVFLAANGNITFSKPVRNRNAAGPILAFYRVFRQRFRHAGSTTQSAKPPVKVKQKVASIPFPPDIFGGKTSSSGLTLIDGLTPNGQERPCWSLRIGKYNRLPFLEESIIGDDGYDGGYTDTRDGFTQWSFTRRYFNPVKNHYTRTGFLLRRRERGGATVGANHRWWFRPVGSRLFFDLKGNAFMQGIKLDERTFNIRGGAPGYKYKMAWNIQIQGQVRLNQTISRQLSNRPGVRLSLRLLSKDGNGLPRDAVIDNDVYSAYKKDHRFGLTLEDILLFRPWQASRLWLGLSVTTNENLNPLSPDYTTIQGGWKQFYQWLQLDVSYRWRRYYRDKNRPYFYDSQVLTARLGIDIWMENRRRLELGMMYSREWLLKKNNFSFFLAWHLGKGRGYTDFNTREMDFKALKTRRLMFQRELKTNAVKSEGHKK